MIDQKEIEELATEYSEKKHPGGSGIMAWEAHGFIAGFQSCENLMIERAVTDFEKWWTDEDRRRLDNFTHPDFMDAKKVWSAAKLSAFRDVKFTNEQYFKLEAENQKLKTQLAEREKEAHLQCKLRVEIEERLDEAEKVIGFYGDTSSWFYPGNDYHDFLVAKEDVSKTQRTAKTGRVMDTTCGGKRARAYLAKYKKETP